MPQQQSSDRFRHLGELLFRKSSLKRSSHKTFWRPFPSQHSINELLNCVLRIIKQKRRPDVDRRLSNF